MGYWTLRKEEVGKMPSKALCVEKDEADIMNRNNTLAPVKEVIETQYFLGLVDDATYNQIWWESYCQENDLDVDTGKSFRDIIFFSCCIF
jgi:hypothetical protein